MKTAEKTIVTVVSVLGLNRENNQLRGTASVRLPQNAADPRMPCWVGEIPSSAVISGSSIPKVDTTMNPETLETIHITITTQR